MCATSVAPLAGEPRAFQSVCSSEYCGNVLASHTGLPCTRLHREFDDLAVRGYPYNGDDLCMNMTRRRIAAKF